MKNYVICATLAISGLLSSCRKEEKSALVGTWNIKETARDVNGNNLADETEIKTDNDPSLNYQYFFESDGTVTVSHVSHGFCGSGTQGTWELQNEGQDLEIVMGNTATKYKVEALTSTELKTHSDQKSGGRSWMTMGKQ